MAHIYTSYFANWRNFPEGSIKIAVTRYLPEYWGDGLSLPQLAPSEELLRQYKNKQIDEFVFKVKYLSELDDRLLTPQYVRDILISAANGRDIILCCYEKPDDFCHRHILAKWLGDDVQELV